jgi:adenosyl cobinamide kinase/adenosyl cobinamide phosphate guanylyltransferase
MWRPRRRSTPRCQDASNTIRRGAVLSGGWSSSRSIWPRPCATRGARVCLLVDCLTLWLSNLLFAGEAARQAEAGEALRCPRLAGATQALIDLLPQLPGRVILVSNEVGWGVVPMAALSRLFADEQGRLNQRVAAVCERVTLVVAGLPLTLK